MMRRWSSGWLLAIAACNFVANTEPVQCTEDAQCLEQADGVACIDGLCVAAPSAGSGPNTGNASDGTGSDTDAPIAGGPWGCLDGTSGDTPVEGHLISGSFVELITRQPPEGLSVRLCLAVDVDCATPTIPDIPLDSMGRYEAMIPPRFDGYFEVTSAETHPTLVWWDETWFLQGDNQTMLVTPASMESFLPAWGGELDPARGILFLHALDCEGVSAEGIRFDIDVGDEDTVEWYARGLFAKRDAVVTDDGGVGGFINVPPGYVEVHATRAEDDVRVGSRDVLVRADWLTTTPIRP